MKPLPTIVATLTACLLAMHVARAQSLSSLHIGDPSSKLAVLGEPAATEPGKDRIVRRWTLPDGNDLAVTTDKAGRILYLESDWNPGKSDDPRCDLPWLRFGSTTLTEIRRRFGSNGFAFKSQAGQMLAEDGAVMLNSYEANGVVITFYNKVSNAEVATLDPDGTSTIADHARLDAISIASPAFATIEWGERVYDPRYKPLTWK